MVPLMWILFVIGIFILILSLIMSPNSNSFSGAIVGSSDLDLFKVSKEKGFKKFLKTSMYVLGISLLILSLIIRLLG